MHSRIYEETNLSLVNFNRAIQETQIYQRYQSEFESLIYRIRRSEKMLSYSKSENFEAALNSMSALIKKLNEYFLSARNLPEIPRQLIPEVSSIHYYEREFIKAHQKCAHAFTLYICHFLAKDIIKSDNEIKQFSTYVDHLIQYRNNPYLEESLANIKEVKFNLKSARFYQSAKGFGQKLVGGVTEAIGCGAVLFGIIVSFMSLSHAAIILPVLLAGLAILLTGIVMCKLGERIHKQGRFISQKSSYDLRIPFFRPGGKIVSSSQSTTPAIVVPHVFRLRAV
jgi:hypothetical protein